MIGKPGEKTEWSKCAACGKSKPLDNLYPLEGEALCMECYSGKTKPGEDEARAKRGRREEQDDGRSCRCPVPRPHHYSKKEEAYLCRVCGGVVPERPFLARPPDRILDVLRLYADADSWGDSNQTSRSTHWKGTQGAGFGPARRLLEEIEG